MSSAPRYVFPLAIRCTPSVAYHATTASTLCAFHTAVHWSTKPSADAWLTSSPRASAVAGCDEHDLALGQALALAVGRAPDEDLAAFDAVDPGLVIDALVERRRPEHLHREGAGVPGDAGRGLRRAEQVVERGGHEA